MTMKRLLFPFLLGTVALVSSAQEAPHPALPSPPTLPPPTAPGAIPNRPRFTPGGNPFPQSPGQAPIAPTAVDPATGAMSDPQAKRFDLDFAGGGPSEFIAAVSKARGKAVNAIIPTDLADTQLPPMRLKEVTLVQIIEALEEVSRKTVAYTTGSYFGIPGQPPPRSYQQMTTSFGFRTKGARTDDAIWYFYCDRPAEPADEATPPTETVRFYQLARYLDAFKVDDITTAIRTGWMLGGHEESTMPKLTFLRETKLLIVRGTPDYLQTIEDVLRELDKGLTPKDAPRAVMPGGPVVTGPPPLK